MANLRMSPKSIRPLPFASPERSPEVQMQYVVPELLVHNFLLYAFRFASARANRSTSCELTEPSRFISPVVYSAPPALPLAAKPPEPASAAPPAPGVAL